MCTFKILTDSCFTKHVCKSCLQCFSSKNVLNNHKDVYLSIDSARSMRLEKGTIEFKNFFKQILVPFKTYSDFECILNRVESYEGSCPKKISRSHSL